MKKKKMLKKSKRGGGAIMEFDKIVKMTQAELKKALYKELKKLGYWVNDKKGFIYAKGKLPVLLVAHLDTVHREPAEIICYSEDRRFVMSPQGIGGDDRAGVYMILQIIKDYKCHVLFCEDEESGATGARKFTHSKFRPKVNYIVELDRRGSNDAVFYDCDNPEFTKFVEGFGFKKAIGSFSDISVVAPHLKIAAVNISAGYFNEHTLHEVVDFAAVENNIERVGKMAATMSVRFEYIEEEIPFGFGRYGGGWHGGTYSTRHGVSVYTELCSGTYHEGGYGSRYDKLLDDGLDEDEFDFSESIGNELDGGYISTYRWLMEIPNSAYIRKPNGEFAESDGMYLIDLSGNVYELLYELDAAVLAEGYEAFSEQGTPVRFDYTKSENVEVVPLDYAAEQMTFDELLDRGAVEVDEEWSWVVGGEVFFNLADAAEAVVTSVGFPELEEYQNTHKDWPAKLIPEVKEELSNMLPGDCADILGVIVIMERSLAA